MGCTSSSSSENLENLPENQLSTSLKLKLSKFYYTTQCDRYFDSLDSTKINRILPRYSTLVARYEWPPWLILTGLGAKQTTLVDSLIREVPCICVNRRHQIFDVQPFGRSQVTFYYGNDVKKYLDIINNKNINDEELLEELENLNAIHIYEEFTFNSKGQITFIEAWSADPIIDYFNLHNTPKDMNPRISTEIAGLGNSEGLINLENKLIIDSKNKDVKEFGLRAKNFYLSSTEVLAERAIKHTEKRLLENSGRIISKIEHKTGNILKISRRKITIITKNHHF